jgi:hypothetical protein
MAHSRRLVAVAAIALVACEVASPASHPVAKTPKNTSDPVPHVAAAEAVASVAVEETSPPPPPRSPYAYANIDPSDDDVFGPPDVRPTCEDDLAAAEIKFKPASLPVFVSKKSKITCGAPQVVMYRGSPEKIAYEPAVMLTCTMALALARFETIVQDEAMKTFGKRVVKIHHLGTYSCREMAAYPGWVSEHSYANAIDLASFALEDGRTIDVLKDFHPKSALATTDKGEFLRAIAQRAYKEEIFSSVLTPFFNKFHASHFHVDLARFRSDGTQYWTEDL